MFTGALLSVFGRRKQPLRLNTTVATIGIRGTGIYVEDSRTSRMCAPATVRPSSNRWMTRPVANYRLQAATPRYVAAAGASGGRIRPAPFINHEDEELALIEALVGREPPFAVFGDGYGGPQLDDY